MVARKTSAALVVTVLVCWAFGTVALADQPPEVVLQVGDVAPWFESIDDASTPWKLEDHVGKKMVVLYFYPADFTTGCTKQAEAWRDNMNALKDAEVEVVGVSGDSAESHKLFKDVWKLNFTLLANGKADIPKKFGVPVRGGGKARTRKPDGQPLMDTDGKSIIIERNATFQRWTFVIDKDGKIAYKNTKVNPMTDSEQVLAFIQSVQASEQ